MLSTPLYASFYQRHRTIYSFLKSQKCTRVGDTSRVCVSALPLLYWLLPIGDLAHGVLYVTVWSFLTSCFLTTNYLYVRLNKRITPFQKAIYFGLTAGFNGIAFVIYRQLYQSGSNTELDYIISVITTSCSSGELLIAVIYYCLGKLPKPAMEEIALDSEPSLPLHTPKAKKGRRGAASKSPVLDGKDPNQPSGSRQALLTKDYHFSIAIVKHKPNAY